MNNQRKTVAPQEVTFDVTTAEEAPTAEMQVEEAELTEEQITEGVVLTTRGRL